MRRLGVCEALGAVRGYKRSRPPRTAVRCFKCRRGNVALACAMMLDFSSDGEPEALWTTDINGADAASFDVRLGKLNLQVAQPGASSVAGIGTGALVWQAGPALATALSSASERKTGILFGAGAAQRYGPSIELGCGCSALPAVALALAGLPHVVASDITDVIPELQRNLAAYDCASAQQPDALPPGAPLREVVVPLGLQWDDALALAALARDETGHGIVLGADVDYAETLHEMLLDAVVCCLSPSVESVAIFASAARCQRTMRLFLDRVRRRGLQLSELTPDLVSMGEISAAPKVDGVRFFAAWWPDETTARAARAQFAGPGAGGDEGSKATSGGAPAATPHDRIDSAVTAALAELDELDAHDGSGAEESKGTSALEPPRRASNAPMDAAVDAVLAVLDAMDTCGSDDDEHTAVARQSIAKPPAASAPPTIAAEEWTRVPASATGAFLQKCAKVPSRFLYPCNAKDHEPRRCIFAVARSAGRPTVHVRVAECAYSEGGTGWRVWPCALLLACWMAANEDELHLKDATVLEIGCGLGLPGIAAAALGAPRTVLSDCLPLLLRAIASSIAAAGQQGVSVAMLDWDVEAPVGGELADEAYSTEQYVKRAQLTADGPGAPPRALSPLPPMEQFGLVLASDVIYSLTHATQLPRVIAARLAADGRLLAMVPVRSAEHTHAFLRGLCEASLRVRLQRVDAAWVDAAVAVQLGKRSVHVASAEVSSYDAKTAIIEGEILFVDATRLN